MSTGALSILHLAANRWWTGSADPTIQLARAQQARGHHVLLAVPPGDPFEAKAREAGVTLVGGFHLPPRLAPFAIAHDPRRFAAEAVGRTVRNEFALGEAAVVVSVARLAPGRGHELLLAGFRALLADVPAARLLLVGKGETRERLERLVAELGLARQVTFAGYRDHDLPAGLAAPDRLTPTAPGPGDPCRAARAALPGARPAGARRASAAAG